MLLPLQAMDHQAQLRWFAREVLPHEPDLRKWLVGRVRGLDSCDVDEVVQEAYARLWTSDADAIRNARAYLFVTARHIVGEHLRRSRIVAIDLVADLDSLNIIDEEMSVHRRLSGQEELARLHEILQTLPPKCRQAFELKKFQDFSQRRIAEHMGIAESTVEKHLAKALRLVSEGMKQAPAGAQDGRQRERRFWKWG
ncbi:RNA polymerase sigma factor [Sphingopyxis panaciterrae]|uniref:RNA polymerase sigma factor n=1 Tax=Sphingopyxis panaciterrae TaxID=363841 RepID=UPI0014249112|nr:RNA polymerase sigma factor [Sphingopyxis panaciterrae]